MEGKISLLEEIVETTDDPAPSHHAPGPLHFETSVPVKFVSAGLAACVADLITFPIDTAKVRLQIQGEHSKGGAVVFKYRGMLRTVYTVAYEEGTRALYSGIIAGLQRQLCFASVRIGLYDPVKHFYIDTFKKYGLVGDGKQVLLRICAGVTTGASCVLLAQPTDVVKIRMQANAGKRYKGCIDAYRTIAKQEGVVGLWKGLLPNVTRNALVNAGELVSYDLIKEAIIHNHILADNFPCHFVSAFGAGFCTTVIASPVDVVKTRFMNSPKGVYRGAFHCAVRMWREGGPMAFYKGFTPSFMRLASWNICMFVTFEQFKRIIHQISS